MRMPSGSGVQVEVNLAARRELVFRFFADPRRFRRWAGEASFLEARVGGKVLFVSSLGPPATGEVREWRDGERIELTWGFGNQDAALVEIDFQDTPEGTRVKLRHAIAASEQEQAGHVRGWRIYLAQLSVAVHHEAHGATLAPKLDSYFAAWAEADPAKRDALLAQCFASDGAYRDRFALFSGREALSAHIALTQSMSPGARVERSGALQLVHAHARVPWALRRAEEVLASGEVVVELDADGLIRSAVSFWDAS